MRTRESNAEWMDRAACKGADVDSFYQRDSEKYRKWEVRANEARQQFCGQCAVQAACLDYAIENNEQYGLWGGMTERERRAMPPSTPRQQRSAS